MAIGDPLYQLADLQARVQQLEQQLRATSAQTAKASPISPLTAVTSVGQGVVGVGGSQDAVSRALSTAIENAFTGFDSIQDTFTAGSSVNFGGGSPITVRKTDYLRPDPLSFDVYRLYADGVVFNASGGAALVEFQWKGSSAGTTTAIGPVILANGDVDAWWLTLYWAPLATITNINLFARLTYSAPRGVGVFTTAVALDWITRSVAVWNPVAAQPELQATSSVIDVNVGVTLDHYIVERLGRFSFTGA
jgi:hypothetical protein